ncbi:MAG: polyprenyl synthetase family protein [Candidatus Nanopelagicales bacterium]|nr:polyprenyl synthetase family protein [Candidatus Nanopelagicales bacterium]MDZ4250580.1 polyprenyl synthetase family protein [Candidatus Nanopelagicales bacterium]
MAKVQAPSGFNVGDAELERRILAGLDSVEAALADAVKSENPLVSEVSHHLLDAGGKRFRPMVVLLAAQYGDPTSPGIIPAAVVVELTHLATLYHDDVMDEAPRRRGTESVNARWGNTIAILAGDFLFARASEILASLGSEAVQLQAQTFERLCVGQIRETQGPLEGEGAIDHHLSVLADKTGSLISTAAKFGTSLSGADEATVDALTAFGERIGVAFQLADDLVDITSESNESGKTPGTDLREGVATLPALIVLGGDNPRDERLRELLSRPLTDDDEHAEALKLLRDHEAVDLARAEAHRRADEARECLAGLPDVAATAALRQLCDYAVARTF